MLIDDVMPRWEVGSRHHIVVNAGVTETYAAIRSANLGAHPMMRVMLGLRALPGAFVSGKLGELGARASAPITFADFEARGFHIVAESAPTDMLIGLEGAFWTVSGRLRPVSAADFRTPVPASLARAAWSFSVETTSQTSCVLRTETRVLTGSAAARRRFRLYWAVVGVGSGLIRRMMLRAIKGEAERTPPGESVSDGLF
jgi:hypothetical protein